MVAGYIFKEKQLLCDERILGQDDFVERIIEEADTRIKGQLSIDGRKRNTNNRILEECRKKGVNLEELKDGSRRGQLPALRVKLAKILVEDYGLPLAETARQLGITTSAILKIFTRSK